MSRDAKAPLKIAQFLPMYNVLGGLGVCVHNISERHLAAGMDVTAFCCERPQPEFTPRYPLLSFHDFKYITATYPVSKWRIAAYVDRLQARNGFDLWQVNGGYPYGALLVDCFSRKGIPCVLRCSGDDLQVSDAYDYGARRNPKVDRIVRANYHKFSALVAITESVRQEYLALGVPDERIHVIPNGADVERIAALADMPDIRKRHGIPTGARLLLTVGRLHPKKRHELIPGMLRILLDQGHDVWWLVVGKGNGALDGRAALGDAAHRLIGVDEISFSTADYRVPSDALIAYYRQADIFVMPSMMETFGIVLVEAMAAGLPLVYFDAPGVRDVAHPSCGAMCPPEDAGAMARAVASLLDGDIDSLRRASLARAASYAWDRIAGAYAALYASLL